jgi:hypothetical protein
MLPRSLLLTLTLFTLLLWPRVGRAELDLRWGGRLQTDLRFRTETKGIGRYYERVELPVGVSRNENIFKLKLDAAVGPITGVCELDFVYYGYAGELAGIGELSLREQVDPYRIEAHAVYIEATNLFVDGLDLRVGQQQVLWGKGDQFNPTNTINANDLEDPLLFGEQLANVMVKLDYTPGTTWTFSGVLVPIFKPALLPGSAPLGVIASDRLPMVDEQLRWRVHAEKAFTEQLLGYPTTMVRAVPDLPERSLENMQWAARVAGTVWEQDIALTYYWGRTDMPQPYLNITSLSKERRCDPLDAANCINGLLETEVHLGYPRMQVVGINMAGEIDLGKLWSKLRPMGYRAEVGVYFPQAASLILIQDELDFGGMLSRPAGEYRYNLDPRSSFPRPLVVEDTPFAKWVVGLDYTLTQHIYVNLQWVHGMADEFGAGDFFNEGWSVRQGGVTSIQPMLPCLGAADNEKCLAEKGEQTATEIMRPRLGDYLVLGVDVKLLSERLLLRLFTIWDLRGIYEEKWDADQNRRVRQHHSMFTEKGFSAVIYPEIQYNVGQGFELGAGALLMLGQDHTKFGDPAAGGSQVFTRARFSF